MKHISKKYHSLVRLTQKEVDTIKTSVLSIDPNAKVYLFGSRTDMMKKGGDIDILIISQTINRKDLSRIRWYFFERFGEQKMDIIVDDGLMQSPFVKMILPEAIEL
jgi:predicted nucleotidyltransferase